MLQGIVKSNRTINIQLVEPNCIVLYSLCDTNRGRYLNREVRETDKESPLKPVAFQSNCANTQNFVL
jgi:hypothetical protein